MHLSAYDESDEMGNLFRRLSRRRPTRRMISNNRKNFLRWLRRRNRGLFKKVMNKVGNKRRMRGYSLSGIDDFELDGVWQDIQDTLKNVLPTIVQSKAQMDLYKAQMKRAERGLPPLNASQIAPTVRVQTELGPETRQDLKETAASGLQKLVVPGLLVGGGLLAMSLAKRR